MLVLGVLAGVAQSGEDVANRSESGPLRLAAVASPDRLAHPPTAAEIDTAIEQGVRFLLEAQNADGSWGSATRTKGLNIYAPIPGGHHAFRAGTTALALAALIEVGDPTDDTVRRSIERAEKWIFAKLPELRRANVDAIYNVWGHAYGIQALVRMYHRRPDDENRRQKIRDLIANQIEKLKRYEYVSGGWGYYDFRQHTNKPGGSATSFTTATVLVAFKEAEQIGVGVPDQLVRRALRSIQRQCKPDGSYLYSLRYDLMVRPMRGINRRAGSLGRSQACHYALRIWGDQTITDKVLTNWLDRLIVRNGWLNIGRKRPVPHEAWAGVAGYFYFYGHYYAARQLKLLSPTERIPRAEHLAAIILKHQERNGSWWDFPFYAYHQPYGTALALMTLHHCQVEAPVGSGD